jgi:hypothetical protein
MCTLFFLAFFIDSNKYTLNICSISDKLGLFSKILEYIESNLAVYPSIPLISYFNDSM